MLTRKDEFVPTSKVAGATYSKKRYDEVFDAERSVDYPVMTAFEDRLGFAVERRRLEAAARVLACPVKVNPPNWQHGRAIYALVRDYMLRVPTGSLQLLDAGTAKGFSACVMAWALSDERRSGAILSVDVMHPDDTQVRRNTVMEALERRFTVTQLTQPFMPINSEVEVTFAQRSEAAWPDRIHFAFVDGKHTYDAVRLDAALVGERQKRGDVILFDDIQYPGVNEAIRQVEGYDVERVWVIPEKRGYAVARRA